MKQGKTIVEMAQQIMAQRSQMVDVVADTRQLNVHRNNGSLAMAIPNQPSMPINHHAHMQIAERLKIPATYYKRMLEGSAYDKDLLGDNINHWLNAEPERRMIRTIGGHVRAFLSDRYRRIDNFNIAESLLPILTGTPDIRVESCELTERRMYIKAVFPRIQGEVKVGDVVQSGIVITNSEVGLGSFSVTPLVFRLACLNGMIRNAYGKRTNHVGKRIEDTEDVLSLYSDETLKADDRALMLKMQDIVRASLNEAQFHTMLEDLKEAASSDPIAKPIKAAEILADRYTLTNIEKESFLANLIQGGDMSKWGVLNAVTAIANTTEDYERATEIETIGGKILDLAPGDWQTLAKAA